MIKKFSVPKKIKKIKKIKPLDCVAMGGHCWNEYSEVFSTDKFGNRTNLVRGIGIYETLDDYITFRTCKHCGFTQKMAPVVKRIWEDVGVKKDDKG